MDILLSDTLEPVGKHGDLLAPCPFCGRRKLHVHKCNPFRGEQYRFAVTCTPCKISGRSSLSRAKAIYYWNTRPQPPHPPA